MVNASIVQVGNRFRMIINEVDVVNPDRDLKILPVARAVWMPNRAWLRPRPLGSTRAAQTIPDLASR